MAVDRDKVRDLFLYAVGKLPAEEWDSYVADACRGDTELQRQTEHLLKLHREAGSFLEQPAVKLWDGSPLETGSVGESIVVELEERPGVSIGSYKLLEQIGEGGCGIVFSAEQTQPIRRKVALKILKRGMDTRNVVARFEAERQALALMDHPYIAHIIDGGETATRRPYFVMELVNGVPITDFCHQNSLSIRSRVGLFVDVCHAVQHAHQKGMIHRDLKPSNVLVTRYDDKPVVKVIDFGIAKVIGQQPIERTLLTTFPDLAPTSQQQQLADNTPITGLAQMIGTPTYMSPEQAGAGRMDVDTRSDIYSLGVLLYELLTGTTPFDKEQLRGRSYDEIRRIIREQEPPRPSKRINTRENAAITFSTQCQSDPRRLSRLLRSELDWIAMKCLEKERNRRYDSAARLADDLSRFLRGEPIGARPVSRREQLWKWARRKPALATLLVVCSLLLTALIVGGLMYNARLRVAVERAETKEAEIRRQYHQAHETLDRMLGRLEGQRLAEVPQLKELQRSLLEDALAFYHGILQQADSPDPAVRRDAAVACRRVADIQQLLGQCESATENYRRAIELTEGLPEEDRDAPSTKSLQAGCYINWGVVASNLGRSEEAERYNGAALHILERLVREQPYDSGLQNELAEAQHNRANLLATSAKPAEAESCYVQAASIRTVLVRDHPEEERYQLALAQDYVNLGLLYRRVGRGTGASSTFEKAEKLLRPLVDRHPAENKYTLSLVGLYVNWSYVLAGAGQSQEALDRIDLAVRLAEAAFLREPQDKAARGRTLAAHGARAEILEFLDRCADSVKDWDRVIELEDDPAARHRWRGTRARMLTLTGDHARAVAEAGELAVHPEHPDIGIYFLAGVYTQAIGRARDDNRLPSAERERLAERYAVQAVALLRKLQAKGYFQDADHANALKSDENLQPLRSREDFRRLLDAVGNK